MTSVRRLAMVGVGAALVTVFSAPVGLVAAGAAVHAAAQCGGEEEEENGTPVSVVHVTDRSALPGQEIGIYADCFTPGEAVDITFCGSSLGTTEADADGRASATVTIPEDGCNRTCNVRTIRMTGEASGLVAVGTLYGLCRAASGHGGKPNRGHSYPGGLTPTRSGPPSVAPTALPFTGAPAGPLSLTGTTLVAAGAMLTTAARRRYRARHAID